MILYLKLLHFFVYRNNEICCVTWRYRSQTWVHISKTSDQNYRRLKMR